MSILYLHLTYEDFKNLEEQMKSFKETTHRSEGGFYHKSLRLKIDSSLIMEFHGPLVGGYGHHPAGPGELEAFVDCILCKINVTRSTAKTCTSEGCPIKHWVQVAK